MMKDLYATKRKNMHSLAEYQRKLWKNPQFSYLFLEVTDCCNLKCKHCGSGCPKCEGVIASHIKDFEKKSEFKKGNTPKIGKILTLSEDYVNQNTDDSDLMCLQCGHVFKNPIKEK